MSKNYDPYGNLSSNNDTMDVRADVHALRQLLRHTDIERARKKFKENIIKNEFFLMQLLQGIVAQEVNVTVVLHS